MVAPSVGEVELRTGAAARAFIPGELTRLLFLFWNVSAMRADAQMLSAPLSQHKPQKLVHKNRFSGAGLF